MPSKLLKGRVDAIDITKQEHYDSEYGTTSYSYDCRLTVGGRAVHLTTTEPPPISAGDALTLAGQKGKTAFIAYAYINHTWGLVSDQAPEEPPLVPVVFSAIMGTIVFGMIVAVIVNIFVPFIGAIIYWWSGKPTSGNPEIVIPFGLVFLIGAIGFMSWFLFALGANAREERQRILAKRLVAKLGKGLEVVNKPDTNDE